MSDVRRRQRPAALHGLHIGAWILQVQGGGLQVTDHRFGPHGDQQAQQHQHADRQAFEHLQLRYGAVARRPEHADAGARQCHQCRQAGQNDQCQQQPGSHADGQRREHRSADRIDQPGQDHELADEARQRRHAGEQQRAGHEREAQEGHGRRNDPAGQRQLVLVEVGVGRRFDLIEEERHRVGIVRVGELGFQQPAAVDQLDQQEHRTGGHGRAEQVVECPAGDVRLVEADGGQQRAGGHQHAEAGDPPQLPGLQQPEHAEGNGGQPAADQPFRAPAQHAQFAGKAQ